MPLICRFSVLCNGELTLAFVGIRGFFFTQEDTFQFLCPHTNRRKDQVRILLIEVHCICTLNSNSSPSEFGSVFRSNADVSQYGGSLENRARFPLRVLAAVRAALDEVYPPAQHR